MSYPMAMAPVVGDTKWSPMLPPPMTGPVGVQQLRPSAFPSLPFGAVASGENVYRRPDMNLYSTGRAPLVVPVRATKFKNGNEDLKRGHPIEHGQVVRVYTETDNSRGVTVQVGGFGVGMGGMAAIAYHNQGGNTFITESAASLPAITNHAAADPGATRQFYNTARSGIAGNPGLTGTMVDIDEIRQQLQPGTYDITHAQVAGLPVGSKIRVTVVAGAQIWTETQDITFTVVKPGATNGGGVIDTLISTKLIGARSDIAEKAIGVRITENANIDRPSYWAIVSETVYITSPVTNLALSVEGTELMKFGDDPFISLVDDYPQDLGRVNATDDLRRFRYQPLAIDPNDIRYKRVQFALVSFPFQPLNNNQLPRPVTGAGTAIPPTTYADAFADLPQTATKTEAADGAVRVFAKLYAGKHGGDVPLGCHLAGADIVHTGVVLHSNDDECHVACEKNSAAAALLESHANPDTHLAARAEFVKTGVPPEHCVSAITNKLLTPEDCEGGLTPHHLDWVGCPNNPRIPGIDEETATKIRDVVQHVAHNRVNLGGAPQGVMDAMAAAVGWG